MSPATSPRKPTAGQAQVLATYHCDEGTRRLVGQRINGSVALTDVPAGDSGRVYLVERHVPCLTELEALLADYLALAAQLGRPPPAQRLDPHKLRDAATALARLRSGCVSGRGAVRGSTGGSQSQLGEYDSTDYPFGLRRPDGRAADCSPGASSACPASALSRRRRFPMTTRATTGSWTILADVHNQPTQNVARRGPPLPGRSVAPCLRRRRSFESPARAGGRGRHCGHALFGAGLPGRDL